MPSSMPRCRTCRLSWPTSFDSSDSPAVGRKRHVWSDRATWTPPAKSGPMFRPSTRRSTTGSGEPSLSVLEHKTCCDRICCGKRNPTALFPPTANGNARAERTASRRIPVSYGNRPGTNRKRDPKRTAGERYTTDSYRRAIDRGCDKAFPAPDDSTPEQARQWKLEHRWAPNRLRHTAATELRKRFGLEAAQVVLGHSAADVTQIYAERDLAKAAAVIREVG